MDIQEYWKATWNQDANGMRVFFHSNAMIRWHNTNEQFTVEQFLRANCEYPGKWGGTLERVEHVGDTVITIAHIFSADKLQSFHVTSFFELREDRILFLDEYWGDDGPAPQWRLDKQIGTAIR